MRSYVPGEATANAVDATARLVDDGLRVTLDFLGEDTLDADQADATVHGLPRPASPRSRARGLTRHAEVSVKLSAIGQALPEQRPQDRARERPHHLPRGPQRRHHGHPRHGGPHHHRLDAGDPARAAQGLPRDRRGRCRPTCTAPRPTAGRSPTRARASGSARAPTTSPSRSPSRAGTDVDRSYVRCLKVLLAGQGYPMIATHDPRMVDDRRRRSPAATAAAPGSYEFQMLYGIRPDEQRRLADAGETVRVYMPYGTEWYGYLMRRLAERPQNLTFFVRSLISKK